MNDGVFTTSERLMRTDLRAFAALYRAHAPAVGRRLRALGVEEGAVEDAVQDVFVTAFRRAHTFEARASRRTWLLGITRRIAARYRRGRARAARRHDALAEVVKAHAAAHEGNPAERRCELDRMLAALDPDGRDALVLGAIEGRTRIELGDALGVRPTTAYSRLLAARRAATAWLLGPPDGTSRDASNVRRRAWLGFALSWRTAFVPLATTAVVATVGVLLLVPRHDRASEPPIAVTAAAPTPTARAHAALRAEPPVLTDETSASTQAQRSGDAHATAGGASDPHHVGASVRVAPSHPAPGAATPPAGRMRDTEPPEPPAPQALELAAASVTPELARSAADLRVELDLLLRARAALRDARLDDAHTLLDEHARRFPASTLARERTRTRSALVRLEGSSNRAIPATDPS